MSDCYRCEGNGEVLCAVCLGTGKIEEEKLCFTCQGTGETECYMCNGLGALDETG